MIRSFAKKFVPYHEHARSLEMRIIKDNLPEGNSIMLDGGVGDGTFSAPLARNFTRIGLDINPRDISKGSGHRVICDLAEVPIRKKVIHFMLSNSVMEHVPRVRKAMSECGRVCRVGATLILTLPSDTDPMWIRRFTHVMYQIQHNLDASAWWDIVEDAGFRMKKEVRYQHKEVHNLYLLSCILLPLLIPARLMLMLLKRLPERGVHICLIAKKE